VSGAGALTEGRAASFDDATPYPSMDGHMASGVTLSGREYSGFIYCQPSVVIAIWTAKNPTPSKMVIGAKIVDAKNGWDTKLLEACDPIPRVLRINTPDLPCPNLGRNRQEKTGMARQACRHSPGAANIQRYGVGSVSCKRHICNYSSWVQHQSSKPAEPSAPAR